MTVGAVLLKKRFRQFSSGQRAEKRAGEGEGYYEVAQHGAGVSRVYELFRTTVERQTLFGGQPSGRVTCDKLRRPMSLEGISNPNAGWLEVTQVSGDNGQVVGEGRGRDEAVFHGHGQASGL